MSLEKLNKMLEAENRRLQNSLASKDAYIKALEEQCRLANELLKVHKHSEALKHSLEAISHEPNIS